MDWEASSAKHEQTEINSRKRWAHSEYATREPNEQFLSTSVLRRRERSAYFNVSHALKPCTFYLDCRHGRHPKFAKPARDLNANAFQGLFVFGSPFV
jgi:hypothetical protein